MSDALDLRCSVVVPCRDGLPDVLEAIASALAQSVPPLEVILVDDGSSDGSAEAVSRRFGDRVRVLSGRRGSAAAARNAGWRAARGEFVAFLDADDVWLDGKLETAAGAFAARPGADWFFSDGAFRTIDGQWHASWFGLYADVVEPYVGSPVAQLFEVNFVLTSSTVVRRAALEAVGGFDESLSHAEDLDLWIKLSRRGRAVASRRALVRYQHKEGGLTRQVERRLSGGARLFGRLAADRELAPELRRLARRRESLYRFMLGVAALREGRTADARREFAGAWMFPERMVPVASAYVAACLPAPWFARLRGVRAAKQAALPMIAVRRVRLEGVAGDAPSSAAGRREGGGRS